MRILKGKPNTKQCLKVLLSAVLAATVVIISMPLLTQPKISAAPGDTYTVPMVSVGDEYTVALHNDGTVWAWGRNDYGQLGSGTDTDRLIPARVVGPGGVSYLTDIIAVSAGQFHTVALKSDGTVWAWGSNSSGRLGNGTTADSLTPVQVIDPTDGTGYLAGIIAISAGGNHTVALKSDGTVWAWGANGDGQLGNGTTTDSWMPKQVREPGGGVGYLAGIIAISTGFAHTVARGGGGMVWAWGQNYYGQLGDGSSTGSPVPVQVSGENGNGFLTDIVAITAGDYHTVAINDNGTVWSWGYNAYGQLGDGTDAHRYTPEQVVLGLTDVIAIAAGRSHTVALKSDGTVWAWGNNAHGELGNGTATDNWTPVQVREPGGGAGYLVDIIAISAGSTHTVALKSDGQVGTLWAWGNNDYGRLGDGTDIDSPIPVQVVYYNVVAIAGASHSMAIKGDGSVWAWGANNYGQLGIGRFSIDGGQAIIPEPIPTQVVGPAGVAFLTDIIAVSTGDFHTVALKSDGTVWAWGNNAHGELGIGNTSAGITRPRQVIDPADDTGFLTDAVAVLAYGSKSVALKSDGTVWALNVTPSQVLGLTDIVAIAGIYHFVALKKDGTVWTMGENTQGQLGDGTTTNRSAPVQVRGPGGAGFLTDIVAISAGTYHTVALKKDGTVWTWGYNNYGQLGDGTTARRLTPVQVADPADGSGFLTGIRAITARGPLTSALKSDGTVWAWGGGGALGDGTATQRHTPVQVVGPGGVGFLTDVIAIAPLKALKSDGTVWAWGANTYGSLGDGTTTESLTPVLVLLADPFTVLLDITPPTGTICIKANDYSAFTNTSFFGLFYKDSIDITITADDDLSGVKTIQYFLSDTAFTDETAMDSVVWTPYPAGGFSITANWKGYIYAHITDKAGHISIICSDGLVVYTDSTPSSAFLSYTLGSGTDKDITISLNGNTFDKIMYGAATLVSGTDYTISGETITFTDTYLGALSPGDYSLTVYYHPLGETYVDAPGNDIPGTTVIALTVYQTYTVTYTYTGTIPSGAPAVPSPESYIPNETVSVASSPSLSGYTFSGWSTASAGVSISGGNFSMPNNDVAFTGTWTLNITTPTTVPTTSTKPTIVPTNPITTTPTTAPTTTTTTTTTTTPTPSTTTTTTPTPSTTTTVTPPDPSITTPTVPTDTPTTTTTTPVPSTTTTASSSTTPGLKTGDDGTDSWALLNLILAILGALLAIGAIIRAFFWHGKNEDHHGTEEKKTRLIWIAIAVVLAIIGFIVFFFTQDTSLSISFVDIWTIANAVIFIAGIISVILAFKREEAHP